MLDFICKDSAELIGRETSEKFKLKMSPPGIESSTLGSPARHLDNFDIGTVEYLCLKPFQNPVMDKT